VLCESVAAVQVRLLTELLQTGRKLVWTVIWWSLHFFLCV
jgi:hypothetical protein